MYRIFISFTILFFVSCFAFGQNRKKIDSLLQELHLVKPDTAKVEILIKLGFEHYFTSKDTARIYADSAFAKAKQIKYPRGIWLSSNNIAFYLRRDGKKEEAINTLLNVSELLNEIGDEPAIIRNQLDLVDFYREKNDLLKAKEKLANISLKAEQSGLYKLILKTYTNYAQIYYVEQDFANAVKYYLKIDSIYEVRKLPKSYKYANIMADLGGIKSILKEFDEAKTYYNKALLIFEKSNRKIGIYLIKERLGINEIKRNNYEEALVYLEDSYTFLAENDYLNEKKNITGFLGDTYIKLKKYKKAEQKYTEQYNLSIKLNDSLKLTESYIGLGNLNLEQGNFSKAINYFKQAEIISNSVKNQQVQKRVLGGLAKSYYENSDYRNAALSFKKFAIVQDSLTIMRNKEASEALEAKYQNEKKEQEITLLKSEKELAKQQKTNQRNLFLGGIGLTSIAGLFFFFLYRNRQKTTKKLQELDALKSKFFTNISHEFRTPLTLISGPIEKRLDNPELNETDRNEFQMIQRNSNRLLNLTNQLLDLSKLESGHLKLKVVQGNLSLLLKAMASSFQHTAKQKNINYTINIAKTNTVWFDKDVIEKTITNLLSNAFKYTPKGGNITFSASVIENKINLYIENNSQKLSKKQIENIFNRFYQIDENAEGVGIGLSLVKELVTLSHGKISVENTAENNIVFKVNLPLLKEQFKPNEITEDTFNPSAIATKNEIIETENKLEQTIDEDLPILLIVDDHIDIRNFIKSAFKDTYQVVEASNGEIGVKKAIELIPDIIISDVMMPILNGFQLTQKLKQDERTCHIPILLLTAKADDADKFMGLETGADDYIIKPFKIKGLETRVKNLIASRLKLRERYSQEIILKPKDIAIANFDEQFLEKIQKVLDQKLTKSTFNVEEFSKSVGMSRMQLHRKLKALTGLSATEFVRSQRLKLAVDLLKNSDANVSEIGYVVGFNDPSYFAKCFKETYGCSPSDYNAKS